MKDVELLVRKIERSIQKELTRVGILYRVFSRVKSESSINLKQERKQYMTESNPDRMQDLIGIRVTLYFSDDIEIAERIIKNKFDVIDEVRDVHNTETFSPTRLNLVCSIEDRDLFQSIVNKDYSFIDATFEIQLRSVLSEGWHEVEHDLRYKSKQDWSDHKDLSRTLNGILATLETSEWSMLSLFDEMSLRSYKSRKWSSLLRSKLRMRFVPNTSLSDSLNSILDSNPEIAKKIFRLNRNQFFTRIIESNLNIPLTTSNVVFLINYIFIGDSELLEKTPDSLIEEFVRMGIKAK